MVRVRLAVLVLLEILLSFGASELEPGIEIELRSGDQQAGGAPAAGNPTGIAVPDEPWLEVPPPPASYDDLADENLRFAIEEDANNGEVDGFCPGKLESPSSSVKGVNENLHVSISEDPGNGEVDPAELELRSSAAKEELRELGTDLAAAKEELGIEVATPATKQSLDGLAAIESAAASPNQDKDNTTIRHRLAENKFDNDNKYIRNPCSAENKFVLVELSEETLFDTIAIANYELYSSNPKKLELLGSLNYSTDAWKMLGRFEVENGRHRQRFKLPKPERAKFLKFRTRPQFGTRLYCSLSSIKAFGVDAIERMREGWIGLKSTNTATPTAAEEQNVDPSQQPPALELVQKLLWMDPPTESSAIAEDASDAESEPELGTEGATSRKLERRPVRVLSFDEFKRLASATQEEEETQTPIRYRVQHNGKDYNLAAARHGARVVGWNKEAKGGGNILVDDNDKYIRNPCSAEDKFVVVELSEETLVDTIVIANYELYSSNPRELELLGSLMYPTDDWKMLGRFEGENVRQPQRFTLPTPESAKFLKLRMLSHFGTEFYCTLSSIEVFGVDAIGLMLEELLGVGSGAAAATDTGVFVRESTEVVTRRGWKELIVDQIRAVFDGLIEALDEDLEL